MDLKTEPPIMDLKTERLSIPVPTSTKFKVGSILSAIRHSVILEVVAIHRRPGTWRMELAPLWRSPTNHRYIYEASDLTFADRKVLMALRLQNFSDKAQIAEEWARLMRQNFSGQEFIAAYLRMIFPMHFAWLEREARLAAGLA